MRRGFGGNELLIVIGVLSLGFFILMPTFKRLGVPFLIALPLSLGLPIATIFVIKTVLDWRSR